MEHRTPNIEHRTPKEGGVARRCYDLEERLLDFAVRVVQLVAKHKLKICLKELRETHRWLRLIHRVPLIKQSELVEPVLDECDQLIRIFVASCRTSQNKQLRKTT